MPLDSLPERDYEQEKTPERRIYVCDHGDICLETRNLRTVLTPDAFVRLLRRIHKKNMSNIFARIRKRSFTSVALAAGIIFAVFSASCAAKSENAAEVSKRKIVTVGGSVTETVYALGAESEIVGTDTSSIYPEEATKLPQVGYQRQLSPEGVLSLKPTLVLTTSLAGIPAALEQIENAGVKLEKVPNDNSVEGARNQIIQIARVLDRAEKGEALIKELDSDLSRAKACVDSLESKPKVLFIHARGAAVVNVAGTKTAGDEMIKLAGGTNVISEFDGYKPMTAETIVASSPDFILMPERSLDSIGGKAGLLKMPGISETPAGKNGKIITMDDLMLLGFSPRLGKAVNELCGKLR
ncbi:MAG: hemin ABC transporter substrate-binding protein [Pyrinomonadaceae bacterium]